MNLVRSREKALLRQISGFLWSNIRNKAVRECKHYKEWFRLPMNYARIMELPLTDIMLDLQPQDRILDVSSPKMLAACYGMRQHGRLVAADLEDYFENDFEIFNEQTHVSAETKVFDATQGIPFEDGSFDKVYSVSVLEHIPDAGDKIAFDEILRVLAPGGTAVITLPVYKEYVEEWTATTPYWRTMTDKSGLNFFQRRYDLAALESRMDWNCGGELDYVLVAEKPVREPILEEGGRLKHNSYLINKWKVPKLINKAGRLVRIVPFTGYMAERFVSKRCHYLTKDWNDVNIRQIAFRIQKAKG